MTKQPTKNVEALAAAKAEKQDGGTAKAAKAEKPGRAEKPAKSEAPEKPAKGAAKSAK